MYKNALKIIISALLAGMFMSLTAYADIGNISAASAVLVEQGSMRVLLEKSAHEKMSMASTTKIMTTILLIESGDLNRQLTITNEMLAGVEGSSVGFRAGNVVTCADLAYGMMLASGNDAANAAAIYMAGSLEKFAEMMNEKAAQIGMTDTHFVTPSGLDADDHYSTAYDMALLASYAMDNPVFAEIAATTVHPITCGDPAQTVYFSNHNRLLKTYEGAKGIKTGFTKKSGRCLVSYAERNGVKLIAVTLKAPDDWNDHETLFDYGFNILKPHEIKTELPITSISVAGGTPDNISIEAQPATLALLDGDEGKITSSIYLPKFVYAPVTQGDTIGRVDYYLDGRLTGSAPIVASQDSAGEPASEKSIIEKMIYWFYMLLCW